MYIVRHGETELNIRKAFQGHTDSPLTAKGLTQAKRNASILQDQMQCEKIISSDLPRARHTASIIGEILNVPVFTDSSLREVYFGFWDGMADEDIQQQYPELWGERIHSKWKFNGYEGESYHKAHERALKWITDNHSPNQLIVSHRSFGKIMRGAYTGLSPEEIMATDFLHTDIFQLADRRSIQVS